MISCIVLAAGESKRFGSPKPLARVGAKTVLELIQEKLLLTEVSEVIVVLGYAAGAISPFIFKGPHIRTVINKDYTCGQTSSFKTGLSCVDPKAQGIMLWPADMPLIEADTINELIKIFPKKSCQILVPTYQGRKGHPPIFSAQLKNELNSLKDDEPLSDVLHRHEAETFKLAVDDEGVVLSFNTPEEFNKLVHRL